MSETPVVALSPELREAIEGLYRAFEADLRWNVVEGCSCCWSAEEAEPLRRTPLRRLTLRDLDSYSANVLLTVGSEENYHCFLPRVFELLAMEWDEFMMPEASLGSLRRAGWRTWPPAKQAAVERYLAALWRQVLSAPRRYGVNPEAGDVLCGIGRAVDDLTPFLETWAAERSAGAWSQLHEFAADISREARPMPTNAFWSDAKEQAAQVMDWLADPHTLETCQQAFFNAGDAAEAELLSELAQSLECIGRAWTIGGHEHGG